MKNIKILTWFNFFTDFRLYSPIAILYFAKVTNSFALGMSIFSIVMISSAILEVPTGIFSDKIGRKRTVMLGTMASVLFVSFYAIGLNFWILAIGAIFEGLSRAFYSGNNDALLYDTLLEKNREGEYSKFLGKTRWTSQLSLGLAAISGGIIGNFSFAVMMWLSVIPQIICVILSFKLTEPMIKSKQSGNIYAHFKDSFRFFIENKKLRNLSIADILSFALGEVSFSFQSAFYTTLWPVWAIGLAKTSSFFTGSISFIFSEKVIKKLNPFKTIILGSVYARVINIISIAFPTIASPALMSTTSIFYGASTVAKNNLLQKQFTQSQRATMSSLNSLGGSITFAFFSLLIGLFADKIGPAKSLLILQFITIPVIFIYLKISKKK